MRKLLPTSVAIMKKVRESRRLSLDGSGHHCQNKIHFSLKYYIVSRFVNLQNWCNPDFKCFKPKNCNNS